MPYVYMYTQDLSVQQSSGQFFHTSQIRVCVLVLSVSDWVVGRRVEPSNHIL